MPIVYKNLVKGKPSVVVSHYQTTAEQGEYNNEYENEHDKNDDDDCCDACVGSYVC